MQDTITYYGSGVPVHTTNVVCCIRLSYDVWRMARTPVLDYVTPRLLIEPAGKQAVRLVLCGF